MPNFIAILFVLVTAFWLASPIEVYANEHLSGRNGDDSSGPEPGLGATPPSPPGLSFPPATNDTVVEALEAAAKFCQPLLPKAYLVDCVSVRLGDLAKQLEGQKGFEEVQEILESASRQLNQIARDNQSTTLQPAAFTTRGQSPQRTTRRLIPVDEAKQHVAIDQAIAVIEEAQTLLLRSAGDPANRSIEFQRISAALGSNKVLLRSA